MPGGLQLVFVIGSSANTPQLQNRNFKAMISAILWMIGRYRISPSDTQVGVVVFGTSVSIPIRLGSNTDRKSLLAAIARINFPGPGAGIEMGLNEAGSMLRGARKDGVSQRLVMFIDGIPRIESFDTMKSKVAELTNSQVRVTAFGIGSRVTTDKIKDLSSNNKGVSVKGFNDVADAVKTLAMPITKSGLYFFHQNSLNSFYSSCFENDFENLLVPLYFCIHWGI